MSQTRRRGHERDLSVIEANERHVSRMKTYDSFQFVEVLLGLGAAPLLCSFRVGSDICPQSTEYIQSYVASIVTRMDIVASILENGKDGVKGFDTGNSTKKAM